MSHYSPLPQAEKSTSFPFRHNNNTNATDPNVDDNDEEAATTTTAIIHRNPASRRSHSSSKSKNNNLLYKLLCVFSPSLCVLWLWIFTILAYIFYTTLLSENYTIYSKTTWNILNATSEKQQQQDEDQQILTRQNARDFSTINALVQGTRQCVPVETDGGAAEDGAPPQRYEFKDFNEIRQQSKGRRTTTKKLYRHPLIVHYVRIVPMLYANDFKSNVSVSVPQIFRFGWQMELLQYLSVLSAWRALQQAKQYDVENDLALIDDVEPVIYIHSNMEPKGKYWDLLRKGDGGVNVQWNYIEHTQKIGGFTPFYVEHEADFHKVNATYTFGGVHSDFDVMLINGKNMRKLQYEGEVFITVDANYRSHGEEAATYRHGFPFMVNCGFYSGVKNSKFLRLWRDMYLCDYRWKNWIYNSGLVPRMLYDAYNKEQNSPAVVLDWQSGMRYRIELTNELADAGSDAPPAAEWLTYPAMHFYHTEAYKTNWAYVLRNSTSVFAQVLRWVQFGASEPQLSPDVSWD